VLSLEDRFARWRERYPDSPDLDEAESRAHRLETEICDLAGVEPTDVRPQSWVDEATRAAG
jgi:hypothetical protein